jgi:hypothetical protein
MPSILTQAMVDRIMPPKDRYRTNFWDAAVPGLALRVYKMGRKNWLVVCRIANDGQQVWMTRPVAGLPSLRDARNWAREVRRLASEGVDPRKRSSPDPKSGNARAGAQTKAVVDEALGRSSEAIDQADLGEWVRPHVEQFMTGLRNARRKDGRPTNQPPSLKKRMVYSEITSRLF